MEIAFAPSITSFIPKKIDQISVQSGLEAQLDIFLTLLFRLDELVNVRESQNCSDNGKNSDPNGKASPGYVSGSSRTELVPILRNVKNGQYLRHLRGKIKLFSEDSGLLCSDVGIVIS